MPVWQRIYSELRDKNFEIVSVAQDTAGVRAAGRWITAASPTYTVLIDEKQTVTMLYDLVNVPTGIWINEAGRIVRPPEVAYGDNRFTAMTHVDSTPYLAGLRDWVANGDRSHYVENESQLKARLKDQDPNHAEASAEFELGEYLYSKGFGQDSIPHFKEAQRLNPDNWNYKRQAWALSDSERDYGTTFMKEVLKLGDKPYYAPRDLPGDTPAAKQPGEDKNH